jgi:anthranilate synthase component 2
MPPLGVTNGMHDNCVVSLKTNWRAALIFLVDNYDSFTYNLVQRLGEIDPTLELRVERNDQTSVAEIENLAPSHLIISPGPCTPTDAGISIDVAKHFAGKVPLLGVCLGHQSIAQAFGASIVRAGRLMHGKTDQIHHDEQALFAGLQNPLTATRYHSLIIEPDSLTADFEVCAWSVAPDGSREIMGIRHREWPVFGVQFHPESFLTDEGTRMLESFLQVESPATAS